MYNNLSINYERMPFRIVNQFFAQGKQLTNIDTMLLGLFVSPQIPKSFFALRILMYLDHFSWVWPIHSEIIERLYKIYTGKKNDCIH